jgi:type VI secretion system secreted protein VgrG
MAITQANRLMSISTPLGEDVLLINKLRATEAISELFRFEIELLHEENEAGAEPTVVDIQKILGEAITVSIIARDGVSRNFSGIVSNFSQGNRDKRFSYYYATVVPQVWVLTQNVQTRIFQHISVPDILKKVFAGFDVKWEISGDFKPRNYCVQYRESDFNFASRLMEEEGIYYYFSHDSGDKMIVANTPQSHRDCPNKADIPFVTELTQDDEFIGSINEWLTDYRLQTGKVTLWDYNFQLPNNKLDAEQPSRFNIGGNQKLEIYEFQAGYARKYDGVDKTGGDKPSELQNIFGEKQKSAEIMMQTIDSQYKTGSGIGDCPSLIAGYRFKLINHPYAAQNGQYVLTKVSHDCEQSPSYVSEHINHSAYQNQFTCIAHGAGMPPFRPLAKTPKPIMRGNQTAIVVGPAGEEIFTDKFGRVKVQFQWDREGKLDLNSSCWIRVVQNWAANKWGTMFIPRVGMEVIVSFLEGDPDQPTITGCVYNPEAMPPYKLPDEKTKSTIKSNSSLGGNGFNEFRFEDKKGKEQIFIHAEKNQDIRVKNDCMELIKHDRHLIIESEQFEKVKKDKHLQVGGDQNEKIGGTMSLNVGGDLQEKVGTNYALDAKSAVHIKAGMTAVIEAGTSLTLKVGGNFININPGGIFVKGTMVMLNSGGAAGSGAGSSPQAPKDPKEADNAEPGQKINPKTPPPPLKPKTFSPKAAAMQSAAKNGTPFCDI